MDLSNQLRQIDFLRMFKLCKAAGIIKNKRKMASECETDTEARTAIKKLFNAYVETLFTDYSVNPSNSGFFIIVPDQITRDIETIRKSKFVSDEITQAYTAIQNYHSDYITSFYPHEIRVNTKIETNELQYESFSRAALQLIEFRKFFEEKTAVVLKYKDKLQELEAQALEKKKKEEEEKQIMMKAAAEEKEKMKAKKKEEDKEKAKLEEGMRKEMKLKAQSLFNKALTGEEK